MAVRSDRSRSMGCSARPTCQSSSRASSNSSSTSGLPRHSASRSRSRYCCGRMRSSNNLAIWRHAPCGFELRTAPDRSSRCSLRATAIATAERRRICRAYATRAPARRVAALTLAARSSSCTVGAGARLGRGQAGGAEEVGARAGGPTYRRSVMRLFVDFDPFFTEHPRDRPDLRDPLTSPTDRAAPGCARRGALRLCRLPSATACGRRSCSTARGPSSRRLDRRCARPAPWRRSPSGRAHA